MLLLLIEQHCGRFWGKTVILSTIFLFFSQDDEDHECGIMSSDVDADYGEGFVCARRVNLVSSSTTNWEMMMYR